VAEFYPLARRHFYRRRWLYGRVKICLISLHILSESKQIVYRVSQILFAAEITFRRLHGCMPE